MPFPPSARVLYDKNPLTEVICQLRFPPVLQIVADAPARFQNAVRGRGYPLYEVDDQSLQLPREFSAALAQLGGSLTIGPEHTAHKFLSEESDRFISLSREFLALTDSSYTRWERFIEHVELAQAALQEVYAPAFYTRVGLRYRDVIDRVKFELQDTPWQELINPALLGALGDAAIRDDVQEIQGSALIALPEPIGSLARLRHGLIRQPDSPQNYVVDVDFYLEGRSEPADVRGILDQFNREAGHLFRWAISPRLHGALGPTTI